MKIKKNIIFILVLLIIILTGCNGGPGNKKNCEHKNSEWKIITDSTCLTLGSKELICNECGQIITTASISLKEHTVVIDEGKKETCTENGLSQGSHCSMCNEVIEKQEIIDKKGHNFVLNTSESTIETLVYYCQNCNEKQEKENDSKELCVNGHTSSDWVVIKKATCKETGLKQKTCTKCNVEIETQEIAKTSHTEVIIEAVEATCQRTGLTEGKKCELCDEIILPQEETPKVDHNYEVKGRLDPTSDKEGYIEYECSFCKETYKKTLGVLGSYDPNQPTVIMLEDNNTIISNNNSGVEVNNNTIIITLTGEYDLTGKLTEGNIIVRLQEEEKAVINLKGVTITSSTTDPIYIESGDKVEISAKSDTINVINDNRINTSTDAVGGAIYSKIDLEIKGKGELKITSKYNNGIASTKDLEIKNLTLSVNAVNNALKGNDSITIESGNITAISSSGDCLKTENSDISDNGNQRGNITINGGTLNLLAAFDAIDASYNTIINGGTINIKTDKYSGYTGEVITPVKEKLYLRISSKTGIRDSNYTYCVKFILDDDSIVWKTGKMLNDFRTKYYEFEAPSNMKYMKFYAYSSTQTINQENTYMYCTDQIALNDSYDTYYVTSLNSSSKKLSGSWTTYSSGGGQGGPGGPMGGGMNEGNSEKETYSCKGIKADNSIIINDGVIDIQSRDDGLHTNSDVLLDTGSYGTAEITINGGNITIYSDDDGIHSDNKLTIKNGNIVITNSYEGIEGSQIIFDGGTTQLKAKDDGINAKSTLTINDGIVYLDAGGDGFDSNGNIIMNGGVALAVGPSNGGNGVLDFDRSFTFNGGVLLAIGASGMNQRPTASSGNTSTSKSLSTNTSSFVNLTVNGEIKIVLKVTKTNQNYCVYAFNNSNYPSATVSVTTSNSKELTNGLYYVSK